MSYSPEILLGTLFEVQCSTKQHQLKQYKLSHLLKQYKLSHLKFNFCLCVKMSLQGKPIDSYENLLRPH